MLITIRYIWRKIALNPRVVGLMAVALILSALVEVDPLSPIGGGPGVLESRETQSGVCAMFHPALEEVVGNAIIDREFRAGLLNGKRACLLSQFALSPEETQALMSIRANSLESFAGQLHGWIEAQQRHTSSLRPA